VIPGATDLNLRERFGTEHPGVFFLDVENVPAIEQYLRSLRWLDAAQSLVSAERAGSGNMNCTVRVRTNTASFILKQSRPWVEKYPSIAAPWNRALVEGYFYEWTRSHRGLSRFVPRMFGFDQRARLLMLEDLGTGGDFTHLYDGSHIEDSHFGTLLDFLARLHRASSGSTVSELFANRDMRRLNHEHIFVFPLRRDNGLDLDRITPGLRQAAATLIEDVRYREVAGKLGDLYLSDGRTLVHGDYFPGSWLRTGSGVKVVDPEFCFFGPPEFDGGCMLAHLLLARQSDETIQRALTYFKQSRMDVDLVRRFAGIEIMRRLIGVAQLPLPYGLDVKSDLLSKSRTLVLGEAA
jgi:5-methylthioribose kinase